jgi:hypothetical protein
VCTLYIILSQACVEMFTQLQLMRQLDMLAIQSIVL